MLLLELVVISFASIAGLAALGRWMVKDRRPRWQFFFRNRPPMDERLGIALAIATDAIVASVGAAQNANSAFWLALAIVVAAQSLLVGTALWFASRRTEPRAWRRLLLP